LVNMGDLSLSRNNLSGSIPESFENLNIGWMRLSMYNAVSWSCFYTHTSL